MRAVPHLVAPAQAHRISRDTILLRFVFQAGETFKGGETVCVPGLLLCLYVRSRGDLVEAARRAVASLHGTRVNQHGGIYNQGVSFSFESFLRECVEY